jgi:hypothetical protein
MASKGLASADTSAALRSRVTNGKTPFAVGGDMRSPWARRARDLMALHLSDLGGQDATSEAERSILRRAVVLEIELERIEAAFSEAPPDARVLDLYQRTTNTLRRTLESLGLQRRAKPVMSLAEYLANRAQAAEEDVGSE